MLASLAKRVAAKLPHRSQQALKRWHFRRQIDRGTFSTNEPEWEAAVRWLEPGDWAIDVGANIGHYTARFSQLVGPSGRVIAFEPVPATFELLAANAAFFAHANVTLLNLAASNATRVLGIEIPTFEQGLKNYYGAALTASETAALRVMTCAIDSLSLPGRVGVLKIDAEGHDAVVLEGAQALLARDHPTVVIESVSEHVNQMMLGHGYARQVLPDSSNVIYRHPTAH
jgi:FkbM family methyltransferase